MTKYKDTFPYMFLDQIGGANLRLSWFCYICKVFKTENYSGGPGTHPLLLLHMQNSHGFVEDT